MTSLACSIFGTYRPSMQLHAIGRALRRSPGAFAAFGAFGLSLMFSMIRAHLVINDVDSAMVPAWALTHLGHLWMPYRYINDPMMGESVLIDHSMRYSNRPPGMILVSVPSQLFTDTPSRWGIAITAAMLTAASVWMAFRLWGAFVGLIVTAGTPLIYVTGRNLWPETVCMAGLLAALLLVRSGRHLWALVPLVAFLTLCRIPFGLMAVAVIVVMLGRRRQSLSPIAGLLLGLAGAATYFHAVFGAWSLVGPYPTPNAVTWSALWIGLISPARGLLWWSPWLLFLRPRRDRATAVAAIAACYAFASWLSYDAWGGTGFAGYRYALPFVILAAPLVARPHRSRTAKSLFDVAVAWSFAAAIVALGTLPPNSDERNPWNAGVPLAVVIAFACAFAVLPELMRRQRLQARFAMTDARSTLRDRMTNPSV
jgi:hypothetical protein